MTEYGIMNEERMQAGISISDISLQEQVDKPTDPSIITIYLKVTDSDIRTIITNPDSETVGSLKQKAFSKELSENLKVRMIYHGRIMLDTQNLSIYSTFQIELSDKAYIHTAIGQANTEDPSSTKRGLSRGFDKLENSGFNVDDIHNLRFHFHAMCIYTGLNKEDDENKLVLEEEWLDGKIPAINANLNMRSELLLQADDEVGDAIDFVSGAMTGIFFSFLVCVFVRNIKGEKV